MHILAWKYGPNFVHLLAEIGIVINYVQHSPHMQWILYLFKKDIAYNCYIK